MRNLNNITFLDFMYSKIKDQSHKSYSYNNWTQFRHIEIWYVAGTPKFV